MTKIKKQHYVPQFYIKKFSSNNENIYVYDKYLDKSFRSKIRNVAQSKFFYDIPELDKITKIKQFVEKSFHNIERETAKTISNLINQLDKGTFLEINIEDRKILAIFMVYQILRTEEARNSFVELEKSFLTQLLNKELDLHNIEPSERKFEIIYTENQKKKVQMNLILREQKVIKPFSLGLARHIWILIKNNTKHKFYTSDNPITRQANIKHPELSFLGYLSYGIEITFPISSQYLIVLLERNYFNKLELWDSKSITITEHEDIKDFNLEQIRTSYRQIFCEEDNFDFAKLICEENPKLRNPKRKKYTIDWYDDNILHTKALF